MIKTITQSITNTFFDVWQVRELLEGAPDDADFVVSVSKADPPYGSDTTTLKVTWEEE